MSCGELLAETERIYDDEAAWPPDASYDAAARLRLIDGLTIARCGTRGWIRSMPCDDLIGIADRLGAVRFPEKGSRAVEIEVSAMYLAVIFELTGRCADQPGAQRRI